MVVTFVNYKYANSLFLPYPRTSPEVMLNHIAVLKGISNSSERKALVEQLLTQTNLWEVRKKSIDTFSGGMKQRFGIAQALLGNGLPLCESLAA